MMKLSMNDWDLVFSLSSISLLLVSLIALIFLRFTLTKRLKKYIFEKGEYYFDSGIIDFDLFNTISFATVCAIPQYKKLKRHKLYVSENINVRQFANLYEIILSYIFLISLLTFLLAAIFYSATDYFGWIQWEYAST